jgi:hypothetical protein
MKKSSPTRIITVVLVVKDMDAAKAIWDAHEKVSLLNGCLVTGIAEGDAISRIEGTMDKTEEIREDILGYGIKLGMTRKQVTEILGEPDDVSTTSRRHPIPQVLAYGSQYTLERYIEYHFGPSAGDGLELVFNNLTHETILGPEG